jgi:acyl carrier protein
VTGDQTTDDPLTQTVLAAFADVMGEPAPRGADTVPDDAETWTSLTHVHLVFEVESRLGLTLPETALLHGGSLGSLMEAARAGAR